MGWLAWVGIILSVQAAASVVALALFSINRRDDHEAKTLASQVRAFPARNRRARARPAAHPAGKRGRFA